MNFRDYTAIDAVNWSSLKALHESPLQYRHQQQHPPADKPAWVLGRAAHCAILEPGELMERYTIWTGGRRAGKKWELFKLGALEAGQEVITAKEMNDVNEMSYAVLHHEAAAKALSGGRAEVTMEWTDPVTNLACKGRADYVRSTRLVDLKTARSVAPRQFMRAAADYLYHGQVAFYMDGALESGVLPQEACFPAIVAVQSSPPWDVAVYKFTPQALDAGRRLYRTLLDRLHECQTADWWPGVAPAPAALELPGWAAGVEDEGPDGEVF